ncbi:hypothetical protein ACLOJK_019993 [Asimina triloba]
MTTVGFEAAALAGKEFVSTKETQSRSLCRQRRPNLIADREIGDEKDQRCREIEVETLATRKMKTTTMISPTMSLHW